MDTIIFARLGDLKKKKKSLFLYWHFDSVRANSIHFLEIIVRRIYRRLISLLFVFKPQ